MPANRLAPTASKLAALAIVLCAGGVVVAAIFDMTKRDFKLPGTQLLEIPANTIQPSTSCTICHSEFDEVNDPGATWKGSLMGQAGRDPLFFAQMTNANQDVANVGTFCLRCHVPMTYVTNHAAPDASQLDAVDRDGVNCHFCHSMVDPIYRPGVSPPEDQAILAGLEYGPPQYYGNAMFVLDPLGRRRGARADAQPMHELLHAGFTSSGNMCGTCHEVGNVAIDRQADGTYRYNALDEPTPDTNPANQFPLERTFSEWRLSAFANGGVDMQGRFGGLGGGVVSSCQDCHMPRYEGQACAWGPSRPDTRRHDFAGASAQVMDIIAQYTQNDPAVDQAALAQGRARSVEMLRRAADLSLTHGENSVTVRVTNQSGHKLPTGHIEGRRVWVNLRYFDAQGALIGEHGHYNDATAELDTTSTTVYEMHVGLSAYASGLTGLPAGRTGHMSLADTIEKDNRIPPRGFLNSAFEAAGAPVVDAAYADGQHWHDTTFPVPAGAVSAQAYLYYQSTPKEYIEELRHNNHTDNWGELLHSLWTQTGRGAPVEMAAATLELGPLCDPDVNQDGNVDQDDIAYLINVIGGGDNPTGIDPDFNSDGNADQDDVSTLVDVVAGGGCP